jgi:hypothetical protein
MPGKRSPPKAPDFPLRSKPGAGLAKRYFQSSSPFLFAGHKPAVVIGGTYLPHHGRRLVGVRPEKFIPFLIANPPTMQEANILCEGLGAWVICPEQVTGTVHADSFRTSSLDFVHSAMLVHCLDHLAWKLDYARLQQIIKNGPHWTGQELLSYLSFDDFDFEMYFLLGGLKAALLKTSIAQYKRERENQRLPVWCVVALLHFIHKREQARRTNRSLRSFGVNQARIEAADFLAKAGIKKGVHRDTIRNHWENMRRSAALIYAAALTDNGRLLSWLLADPYTGVELLHDRDTDPYLFDLLARVILPWFKCANAVAEQLLAPLGLLDKKWKSLEVDGVQEIPAALTDERMQEILTKGLTRKDLAKWR